MPFRRVPRMIRNDLGTAADAARASPSAIVAAIAALFVLIALVLPASRIGDGHEYIATYFAWRDTGRPIFGPEARADYLRFEQSGGMRGLPPPAVLDATLAEYRRGDSAEMPHFWAYSGLAALIAAPATLAGFRIGPAPAFLALHAALLALLTLTARARDGIAGVGAIVFLLFASPIIWWLDKIHTEFFTVCLGTLGIVQLLARRYVLATLAFAVASTQNPPFAALAAMAAAMQLIRQGTGTRWRDFALIALAGAISLLHPVYYWMRLGVPTPQLLRGADAAGVTPGRALLWLFDPDLGLLTNWPTGLLIIAVAWWYWRRTRPPIDRWHAAFFAAAIVVLALAMAGTTNLNSGGTRDIQRYALWFLPFFYPALRACAAALIASWRQRRHAALAAAGAVIIANLILYNPVRSERYWVPSTLSRLLQDHLPGLYDPPFEVFRERYGHLGEHVDARFAANRDCSKLLVHTHLRADDIPTATCRGGFDRARLYATIRARLGPAGSGPEWTYLRLGGADLAAARRAP